MSEPDRPPSKHRVSSMNLPVRLFSIGLAALVCGLGVALAGPLPAGPDGSHAEIGASPTLEGRQLTFSDEFDSLRLVDEKNPSSGVWTPRYPHAGANQIGSRTLLDNREQQIYVDPTLAGTGPAPLKLNPFKIQDGVLQITASPMPASAKRALWNYSYMSGVLTTKDRFAQKYGYFEMRAKMPKGQGLWPAFWLLPADRSWPPEIDIVEILGHQPNLVNQTAHWNRDGKHVAAGFVARVPDSSAAFHTYGVEWNAQTIRWFVDGRETARIKTPPELHRPMYVLVNLAVGGGWPGKIDPRVLPATMYVDYVRAYSLPDQAD